MILAGMRYGFVLALRLGVVFAHGALQLGEFADDFGEQVRLAQSRRTFCFNRVGADQRRQFGGQSLNPFNALGLGAKLLVKHDVLELWQAIFEFCL